LIYPLKYKKVPGRIEDQEKERLRKLEEAKREELRELKYAELEKVKLLEEQIEVFHKSNVIRNYIKASKSLVLSPLQENLLKWAAEYADHIDPTKDFRISILDENC